MSFKDDMGADLNVFYNTDEFATIALFGEVTLRVNFIDNFETEGLFGKAVSILTSEDPGIKEDDELIINGKVFEVNNIYFKDESRLERVIGLTDDRS